MSISERNKWTQLKAPIEFDDIMHYQKIIVALTETDRLMKEIDAVEIKWMRFGIVKVNFF